MKICLVSLQYGNTSTGGGGVHVSRIAAQYAANAHKTTVISMHTAITEKNAELICDKGIRYSTELITGIKVIRIQIEKGLENPYVSSDKIQEFERIRKFCNYTAVILDSMQKEFDVVHYHGHHLIPGYLADITKDMDFKVISTIHFLESTLRGKEGLDHINIMPGELFHNLKRWEALSYRADKIVVISPGQRDALLKIISEFQEELGITLVSEIEKKLILISSGVENSSLLSEEKIKNKWKDSARPLNILSYSRLDPSKGLHYSIRAFKDIKMTDSKTCLTVAGIPARGYEDTLRQEQHNAGSDGCELVLFDRIATKQERDSFFDRFDIYMFPTLSEPFGITIIEATARGLFVVTTDSAGPLYIMHDKTVREYDWGFVSRYGINIKLTEDHKKNLTNNIVKAWEWITTNRNQITEKIINFRRLIKKKYTWEAVVGQYIDVYSEN